MMTPTWDEVLAAIGVAQGGDREVARESLRALWVRAESPAQQCVLAHFLADVQDDVADEIRWDEAALAAHASVTDADLAPIGVASAAGFLPSLHLNLGDGYLRQGRVSDARRALALAHDAVDQLVADGYGAMIRRGLDGLEERLASGPTVEP